LAHYPVYIISKLEQIYTIQLEILERVRSLILSSLYASKTYVIRMGRSITNLFPFEGFDISSLVNNKVVVGM